jgi:BTB/POZ domain
MFTSDLAEKRNNKTRITDSSKEAFEEFLYFIYTGEVKNMKTHVVDLLALSHKYEVTDLNRECEDHLIKGLDEFNAHDVFQYAHLYNCSQDLKLAAFSVIKR